MKQFIHTLYSHCLAYGPDLSPDALRKNLLHSQGLDYTGMVIVPALLPPGTDPAPTVQVFKELGMNALVCGFNPGGPENPDPILGGPAGRDATLRNLRGQIAFAAALRDAGLSPSLIVGPMHEKHREKRIFTDESESVADLLNQKYSEGRGQWFDILEDAAGEFDMDFGFEALNPVEDFSPEPFVQIAKAASERRRFGIHFDTGHAYMQDVPITWFVENARLIRYMEFANVGRNPLEQNLGINFSAYTKAMLHLHSETVVGVEPFGQKTIDAFDLKTLCNTTTPGDECLVRDIAYLRSLA